MYPFHDYYRGSTSTVLDYEWDNTLRSALSKTVAVNKIYLHLQCMLRTVSLK